MVSSIIQNWKNPKWYAKLHLQQPHYTVCLEKSLRLRKGYLWASWVRFFWLFPNILKLCCREKMHVGMEVFRDLRLRKWTWVHVADCVDYEMGEKDVFFAISHNPALLWLQEAGPLWAKRGSALGARCWLDLGPPSASRKLRFLQVIPKALPSAQRREWLPTEQIVH